jgi:heat shock transcription factor
VEKLFEVVCAGGETCGWTEKGDGLWVKSVRDFEAEVLSPCFGHGNYASFVRQLNQYGFHKDRSSKEAVFRHPYFMQDKPEALSYIVRKQSAPKVG